MIKFRNIPRTELDEYIKKIDNKISFIQTEFGFDLQSYGNFIRIALNAIQKETIEDLIERIKINRELERGLDNAGGYTIEYLEGNNPKSELLKIMVYLKDTLSKQQVLFEFLNKTDKRTIAVVDNNDIAFVSRYVRNRKVQLISFSSLKKLDVQNKTLVFHSFNGQKDFDYLYNLDSEIRLILYKQEKNLYHKYLDQRKKLIEQETKSSDRFQICRIEYKEVRDNVADISSTISGIVTRLDEMNNRVYEGYKDECDLILDEIEEKLLYKVISDRETLYLESNDSIFTDSDELIKSYKIKVGDKIRVYPKEQLAENLYKVAVETEPEIFGVVEEHATFWKNHINELRDKIGDDLLYKKLKENGLRILPTTLETYGKGIRKFPMFNNDLRAILKLHFQNKSNNEINDLLKPILKSKTIYNSTMIALGRGLKQELHLFLKEKKIGEILQKRNFNRTTLRNFINEFMPIHTVIGKEIFNEDIDDLAVRSQQLIEL